MEARKRVLVLSEVEEDTELLEANLRSCGEEFVVDTVYTAQDAVDSLKEEEKDLLIFNLKSFSTKKINAAIDLRKMGVPFPLISIANRIDEESYRFVSKLDKAVLLGKPYENEQLITLSQKMSSGQEVMQRKFPRYNITQVGLLSAYPSGEATEVRLVNLSKGGVCLELSSEKLLNKEDMVRVKIFLSEVGKTRELVGRVTWVGQERERGVYRVGLKFVSEGELFRSLLSVS